MMPAERNAMTELALLCAGAAQGVVKALQSELAAEARIEVRGTFGAVGAMKEKLLAGEPCDAIVLTAALIDDLGKTGHVLPATAASLGSVGTGIAVRAGERVPDAHDGAALRAALLAAKGIYLPDPQRATAGIHFVGVLDKLGIRDEVAARLRPYPNGATAMRELAQSTEPGLIGCTQVSEILYTSGVTVVGALPAEFALATVYSVAVSASARHPAEAARFARLLSGDASRAVRVEGGFEV
jgi:molybdate transport system substrate-binding protein